MLLPSASPAPSREVCIAASTAFVSDDLGVDTAGGTPHWCGSANHVFSHIKQDMYVQAVVLPGAPPATTCPPGRAVQWVRADELATVGLTTWACKVLELALRTLPGHDGSTALAQLQARCKPRSASRSKSKSTSASKSKSSPASKPTSTAKPASKASKRDHAATAGPLDAFFGGAASKKGKSGPSGEE